MIELNTSLLVDIGGWPALKEARALVAAGRVLEAAQEGAIIRARVKGGEKNYDAQIVLGNRVADVETRCTCIESRRSGRVCAHALAAGLAILDPSAARPKTTLPPVPEQKSIDEIPVGTDRPSITVGIRPDGALELASASPLAHFVNGKRIVPRAALPDFFAREWPVLDRQADLSSAPGLAALRLETERPVIEARLDGALAGLTLELIARYPGESFPVATAPDSAYRADPAQIHRFWRRNPAAEKEAIAVAEAAGFTRGRGGVLGLLRANEVGRFLANRLPEWRRNWTVIQGERLEATLRQVDVAEPEFTLRGGSGEAWLGLDLKLSVGGKPLALESAEIQRWLQTGQSHTRREGRVLLVPTEAWSEMGEVMAESAVEQEPGRMRISRRSVPFLTTALRAQGFKENGVLEKTAPPRLEGRLAPELLARLRPYQRAGVEWLAGLAQQGFHGLLGDDMGLGKTLQALAFAAWLKAERTEPVLVVCPTSLVTNWQREAAKFAPHLRTLDLTGADRAEKKSLWGKHDLLVTSYAILRRDLESFRAANFSLVILDEAQHIKNRGSQNAQSAKALQAAHRLILTGTPLENSVLDLWSLYDFLLPGYLGTATEFRERYESPLARGTSPRVMERLRHRVRPFFLRRTKEEVLTDLPPRLDHLTLCELSDEQREVYRAVLAQGRRDVFEKAGKNGQNRLAVLTTLLRLRQVSCHLGLLPAGDPSRVWQRPSAKLERTFELIDEAVDGGHRVLIFSQFVQALHLLRDEARRREIEFCYLDGQTIDRQAEVDRFQTGPVPLFFISLKAGGTGLNLTGADTVIHFDPWWNPAVEEQATARAHRLGQTRLVQAYRLIAAGTVEEKIAALQARKRELFEASVQGDEAFAERLTRDDLEELLAEPA